MATLSCIATWKGRQWKADLSDPLCIAIPLTTNGPQPNAFFAPLYEATPHRAGDWVGDTHLGASVNFFDVRLNPHGNGTHTETVGHISKERYPVHHALKGGRFIAQLISVYPVQYDNGDRVINELEWEAEVEAIIIRTLPNHPDKMGRQYSGTNPPYLHFSLARKMAEHQIQHLLLDLPSVDREEDGGKLEAHKAFWSYPENPRTHATITEMIYVDNDIPDGLYLLELQIPAMELDAAPSRPFLYTLR